jgi:formiminotetrahydrofolate cyclodeaminase
VSDVGVGALATRACIEGAALNVRINLAQLKDEKVKSNLLDKMGKIFANSGAQFLNVFKIVVAKLNEA